MRLVNFARFYKIALLGLLSVFLLSGCGNDKKRAPQLNPPPMGQQPPGGGGQVPPGTLPGGGTQPGGGGTQPGGGTYSEWDYILQLCEYYYPDYFEECVYSFYYGEDYGSGGGDWGGGGSDFARMRRAGVGVIR